MRQKVFQKKSDRFVYDVSISSKAKGNNAFGLLQETPLVSSTDGKSLKILGKSSAIIYINGRKTNMDAEAITEYLKNIPSEQIQRIEVITTPGSEFQVEANDGIINIVMKKQLSDGYNGTLKLSDNQGYYNNPGAGANFNFRKTSWRSIQALMQVLLKTRKNMHFPMAMMNSEMKHSGVQLIQI